MCPPDHFSTHFLLNPWMRWDEEVDRRRAAAEWEALRDALTSRGVSVEVIPPSPVAPAMCFTRDALLHVGDDVVVLANDGPRGDAEPVLYAAWLRRRRMRPLWPPDGLRLDGGNLLRCSDGRWLVGLKPGHDRAAASWIAERVRERTGDECVAVPLADVRYLHLDMVLADLAGRAWLVYPAGFAEPDLSHPMWQRVLDGREVIEITDDEAVDLSCNVVCLGHVVVGGRMSRRLVDAIHALGLECVSTPLDEFRKAGGGAHCLTVELPPDGGTDAGSRPPRRGR